MANQNTCFLIGIAALGVFLVPSRLRSLLPVAGILGLTFAGRASGQEVCQLELEPRTTLGALEDETSVQAAQSAVVAAVPWGGWGVAERGAGAIQYDVDGSFAGALGARGQGPGELRDPVAIAVDPFDTVWVSDYRGRAVLFGPDGSVARTVVEPDLQQIHGFTPEGHPFSGFVAADRSTRPPEVRPFVQIWDREGGRVERLGLPLPDRFSSEFAATTASTGDALAEDEVVHAYSLEGGLLVRRGRGSETLELDAAPVAGLLGVEVGELHPVDVRVVADGYVLLMRTREVSPEREDEFASEIRHVPGYGVPPPLVTRRQHVRVMSRVWDGRVVHVSRAGELTVSPAMEIPPWGFSADDEVYSFSEDPSGLIRVHITAFRRTCTER